MKPVGHWDGSLEDKRYHYDLNRDSIVLDFGGYTGLWARDLANRFGCKVHSYEAVERYFKQISWNNVIPYQYAITCETGIEYFHVCDEGSTSESLSEFKKKNDLDSTYQSNVQKLSEVPLEKINTLDVNEVLEKFDSVDLLKINIEGGEYDILTRMCNTGTISKVKSLQVQFHNFVDDAQQKYDDITTKLKETHNCDFDSMWRWSFWSNK
jgi:FkbM family methyltransferase